MYIQSPLKRIFSFHPSTVVQHWHPVATEFQVTMLQNLRASHQKMQTNIVGLLRKYFLVPKRQAKEIIN